MKFASRVAWLLALMLTLATSARAANENNFLRTREFRVDGLRQSIPLIGPIRQNLRCWQISEGSWNGQSLAGLTLVLVQNFPDQPQGDITAAIYVSDFASPAQRDALVSAMKASHPLMFADANGNNLRVEPAVIRIEQVDPTTIVLRLALIA